MIPTGGVVRQAISGDDVFTQSEAVMDYRNNVKMLAKQWREDDREAAWMVAYWAVVLVGGMVMFYAGTGGL